MILVYQGARYVEHKFDLESDFEAEVVREKESIFGGASIYIDAKQKIGSTALGSSIPDGFLFDMSDPSNSEFYLVEVELESHDFYKHIFPQITKFFAFYRNRTRQNELVRKLFDAVNTDASLKGQFKKYLGDREIFKFLSDLVDSSQNILLVIDGSKPELPEISDTYSDTWGKMVRVIEIRKFVSARGTSMLTVTPEFEALEFSFEDSSSAPATQYSEEMHLEGTSDMVKAVYSHLKDAVHKVSDRCVFNPQKYYISIKGTKNIVFLKLRKKKIRMVVLMPENDIRARIHHHPIRSLSDSVQKYYNAPCAAVDVMDLENIGEIIEVIRSLMNESNSTLEPEQQT